MQCEESYCLKVFSQNQNERFLIDSHSFELQDFLL